MITVPAIMSPSPARRLRPSRRKSSGTPPAAPQGRTLGVKRKRRSRGHRRVIAMQSQNRFFDDIARVASGAVGAISGVRGEIESRLRDQLERVLVGMDLVSREEFEAVKAMAAKPRQEHELLPIPIAALAARPAGSRKGGRGKPAPSTS